MTSEERRAARFCRRKARRQLKKQKLHAAHDSFEEVFSYEHLYRHTRNAGLVSHGKHRPKNTQQMRQSMFMKHVCG